MGRCQRSLQEEGGVTPPPSSLFLEVSLRTHSLLGEGAGMLGKGILAGIGVGGVTQTPLTSLLPRLRLSAALFFNLLVTVEKVTPCLGGGESGVFFLCDNKNGIYRKTGRGGPGLPCPRSPLCPYRATPCVGVDFQSGRGRCPNARVFFSSVMRRNRTRHNIGEKGSGAPSQSGSEIPSLHVGEGLPPPPPNRSTSPEATNGRITDARPHGSKQ